jgi:hypothetical protein
MVTLSRPLPQICIKQLTLNRRWTIEEAIAEREKHKRKRVGNLLSERLGRLVLDIPRRRDVAWPDCARALSSALGRKRDAVAGLRKPHSDFLELGTVHEVFLIVVSTDEAELLYRGSNVRRILGFDWSCGFPHCLTAPRLEFQKLRSRLMLQTSSA